MKKKFSVLLISAVILGLTFSLVGMALVSQAAPPERPAKPDKEKPVPATDVELVKKVTIHGTPRGGGKPSKFAATGILGATTTGEKYAIVIGISNYPGTENDLRYADEDAEEMIDALKNYGFFPENIFPFIDKGNGVNSTPPSEATYSKIISAIKDLKDKVVSGDEVVFFFSGHGGRGKVMDGNLEGTLNDSEQIDESIVVHDGEKLVHLWDGELGLRFAEFKTSRIVFIFDSCVAGGMTDLKASGRVINMATTEGGTAYEYSSLENGQFTYYFVDKGMLQGFADRYDHDKDGIVVEGENPGERDDVVVEEAFDYAKKNCSNQTPTISDSFTNDLLL